MTLIQIGFLWAVAQGLGASAVVVAAAVIRIRDIHRGGVR